MKLRSAGFDKHLKDPPPKVPTELSSSNPQHWRFMVDLPEFALSPDLIQKWLEQPDRYHMRKFDRYRLKVYATRLMYKIEHAKHEVQHRAEGADLDVYRSMLDDFTNALTLLKHYRPPELAGWWRFADNHFTYLRKCQPNLNGVKR